MNEVVLLDRRRYVPFALAMAAVVGVSAAAYTSHLPALLGAHGVDKVLHATMGMTLTLLLGQALRGRAVLAGLLVMVPLAVDEYLQRFSSARSSDWADLLADVVGVLIAMAVTSALASRRRSAI